MLVSKGKRRGLMSKKGKKGNKGTQGPKGKEVMKNKGPKKK
jgi:hypothetical protein